MLNLALKDQTGLRCNRSGLSLLEVILAMAILGIAMAVIGQLFNLGYRSARQATLRNEANILCDAKMAEVAAGVIPLQSGGGAIEEAPEWTYAVEVESATQPGLLVATVTISQLDARTTPVSMSVVRLVPDPDFDPEQEQ